MTNASDALGIEFLNRTLRTAGIVLLVALPFDLFYFGVYPALAVLSGGVWGLLNFIFLSGLIRHAMRPEGADGRKVALFALFKFPLLYAAGYFLLRVPQFGPVPLLIGFSIVLAVLVLRAAAVLVFKLDAQSEEGNNLQRAV